MKKSHTNRLGVALMVLNLLLIAGILCWLIYDNNHTESFAGKSMQQANKYTLYVGTNDSTTHTQQVSTDDMKAQVDAICEKQVQGFTVFRAGGNWYDSTGTKVREDTLVYCFYNASDKQLKNIMDEVQGKFHQSALVLEKSKADIIFYSGDTQK